MLRYEIEFKIFIKLYNYLSDTKITLVRRVQMNNSQTNNQDC